MTETNNMTLWESVCETDPKYTKAVKLGSYRFTDIDSTWNIRRATAKWGPFGSTWGLKEFKLYFIGAEKMIPSLITIQGKFVYPGGEFDIAADMPYDPKGEVCKKLQTMCIGKALSRLGFSADVYMGMFDDSTYVKEMQTKFTDESSNEAPELRSSNEALASQNKSLPEEKYANRTDNHLCAATDGVVENKKFVKKTYPEPDPVASGILGSLAQKYMDMINKPVASGGLPGYVINFKKLCHAVYDKFNQYPTKMESIPKIMDVIQLESVAEKNDFLEGIN